MEPISVLKAFKETNRSFLHEVYLNYKQKLQENDEKLLDNEDLIEKMEREEEEELCPDRSLTERLSKDVDKTTNNRSLIALRYIFFVALHLKS